MDKNIVTKEAYRQEDTVRIDLWYPRIDDNASKIQIGLMDTRAADDIRISYDFVRDGWKIEQASICEWDKNDKVCDPGWKEVAFVRAWASSKKNPSPAAKRREEIPTAQHVNDNRDLYPGPVETNKPGNYLRGKGKFYQEAKPIS